MVNFTFPKTPEFDGLEAKTYRVERLMPISRLVASILGRVGVSQPGRFTVSTLDGFVLPDTHCLADYGLGSLLPNWELLIVDKVEAAAQTKESREERATLTASMTTGAGNEAEAAGRVSLLILFVDDDWPVKLQRLLIAPSVTLGAVMQTLVEKHGYTRHPTELLEFRTFEVGLPFLDGGIFIPPQFMLSCILLLWAPLSSHPWSPLLPSSSRLPLLRTTPLTRRPPLKTMVWATSFASGTLN